MKLKIRIVFFLILMLLLSTSNAFAYDWAKETSVGIPSLTTPFKIVSSYNVVNSSWNEPRTTEIHKGTDHRATTGTDLTVLREPNAYLYQNGTFTDGTKYQVIEYVYNGTWFYSLYLHLYSWVKTVPGESDVTAKTGDSGSPGAPHLHFEINSNNPAYNFGARISVNPVNYIYDSFQYPRSVFNFWSVQNLSSTQKRISILAADYDLGTPVILNYVTIYYKMIGTSTWYGPYNMTSIGGGNFYYDLTGIPGKSYDVVIAGRRSTTEYWVTYPAKKYTEIGKNSTIPMSSLGTWDTKVVSF